MSTYYITLPNGRRVGLRAYARAWAILHDHRESKSLFPGFFHFPEPAGEILAWMRRGLHDRINARGGLAVPPDPDGLVAFAAKVNHPRLVLEPSDRHFLSRFPRRIQTRLEIRFRDSES